MTYEEHMKDHVMPEQEKPVQLARTKPEKSRRKGESHK